MTYYLTSEGKLPGPPSGSPEALDGGTYRWLAGVIRNDGAGWAVINDGTHRPVNIESVTSVDGGTGGYIRISYPQLVGATGKVVSLIAAPDEALGRSGFSMGASVTTTYADISISQLVPPVSDYISYNGTAWAASGGQFTGVTFNAGKLTITHPPIPDSQQYDLTVTPRGGAYRYAVTTGTGAATPTSLVLEVYDTVTGALATTPSTDMKLFLTHGGGTRQVKPSELTTTAYPLSNIWIYGVFLTS